MTQQTDTVDKSFSNSDLNEFLQSDQQTIRIPDRDYFNTLVKVDTGYKKRQFTYIAFKHYSNSILGMNLDRLDVIGIYDNKTDRFYITQDYTFDWHMSGIDCTKYIDFYKKQSQIREALKRIVYYQLDQQKEQILTTYSEDSLTTHKKEKIQELVRAFLLNEKPFSNENRPFDDEFPIELFYGEETPELCFDYLINEETELLVTSERLFRKEEHGLHYIVFSEEYFKAYRQQLLEDKNFLNQQRLYKAVRSKPIKSFTIHYKENGHELMFKVENRLRWQNAYLPSWDIQKIEERNQFRKLFSDTVHLNSIEAITYARKVIYQKET